MPEELTLTPKDEVNEVVVVENTNTSIATITEERLLALDTERQKAVTEFAEKINIADSQLVTSYGNIPLKKVADVCGDFLQKMSGTTDDKDVVQMLTELSEATNSGQKEIEILAKKPNFIQRLFYLFSGKNQEDEMKIVIKDTYDLVSKLQSDMKESLDTLIERGEEAKLITEANIETANSIEEYLIAGYIALQKAKEEAKKIETSSNINDQMQLASLQSGIRMFEYKLKALEEAKASTIVAATQAITDVENMNTLHLMIESKSQIIVTIFSQMGSNAILNNTTKRIIEGQRTLDEMSRSMFLKVSQDTADSTVAIAESFSKGVLDADTLVQCMEIMHKGYQDAASYYRQFSENREIELRKIRDAEQKMMPVLNQAIDSSSVKIKKGKNNQKLTL